MIQAQDAKVRRNVIALNLAAVDHVITPLTKYLGEKHGIDVILVTGRKMLSAKTGFFDSRVFKEVVDIQDALRPRPMSEIPTHSALAEQAQDIERRLGVNVLDILRGDRHLGIGFVTGARFIHSRYGSGFTHHQALDLAIRLCLFFETLIDRVNPAVVFGIPGTVFSSALVFVAEAKGIPMRFLRAGRRGDYFWWESDRYAWPPGFADAYASEAAKIKPEDFAHAAPETMATHSMDVRVIASFRRDASPLTLLRRFYEVLRADLRRSIISPKHTYGLYGLTSKLLSVLERWWWSATTVRQESILDKIPKDLPFVFYPLHIEPEKTLMVEALASDNQMTVIDWLAKTAPAGWYIVVKEHPRATSPRPKGFWDQLRQYPNVIVAHTLEPADAYVDRAKAVGTINGTVGLQAAAVGKPVISFHRKFIGAVLPHVLVVSSYDDTRAAMRSIRDGVMAPIPERRAAFKALTATMERFEHKIDDEFIGRGINGTRPLDAVSLETIARTFMEGLPELRSTGQEGSDITESAQERRTE